MKVVCVNNVKYVIDDEDDYELSLHNSLIENKGGGDHLIEGKIYDVLGTDVMDFYNPKEVYYSIVNESGQKFWYSSNRFKEVSEVREEKLNNLGIV
jgi:hypothetical protein